MIERHKSPEHWQIVQHKEIAEINPRLPFKDLDDDLMVSFIPMRLVEEKINLINLSETKKYKDVKKGYTPVINGDIIFAKITPCMENGKCAIVHDLKNGIGFGSTEFHVSRAKENVLPNFLFYFLIQEQFRKDALHNMTGSAGQKRVPTTFFSNFILPLPPIGEQQEIVSKLEELFSKLDNGVKSLKTLQQQLKVYRQSVLKWAFEGRLTNANVKDGELPEGWEWKKSGELFDFVTSGSRGWAKYYSESGALFIRITNLDFDSLNLDLSENTLQFVNPPINAEGLRTKVQEGDFLFSITGYLGMFAIAPKIENAYINQHISLCRPKDNFNKKFVGYWIISKSGGHYHLNQLRKGATKAGLGLDDIKNFPVPIAPLKEQNLVVQEIESRLSVCDKIEEIIANGLKEAEALRQSILKQAFEGKLV